MARVSVFVPAYQAEQTFRRSLASLRFQQFRDFELIVVETGPKCGIESWLDKHWPDAVYLHDDKPHLPHDALNLALEQSQAELCAFTDIDAYPESDWLDLMIKAFDRHQQPIVGGVKCYGRRWIDRGAHLVKFDKWLHGLEPQLLEEGPTVNLLIPRKLLVDLGGFRSDTIHADTDISWRLRQRGSQVRLVPGAVVKHHHLHSWGSLLRERYRRGAAFAVFMTDAPMPGPMQPLLRGLIGILPMRLTSQLWRVAKHAHSAGLLLDLIVTLPIVVSGMYAWLLGESIGYLKQGISID